MVTTICGADLAGRKELYDELHRFRYRVFVRQRRWSLPVRGDLEVDQYDGSDAVYFYEAGESGAIESHLRLTPSTRHSLLADCFPHLAEGGLALRDERIYEATRYIVLPSRKSRRDNRRSKARLVCAMIEWCRTNGVTHIQTVVDALIFPSFLEMTSRTIPLGLPHPYGGGPDAPGGGTCIAFRWPITTELAADIRAYGGIGEACAGCARPCAEAFAA